MTNIRRITYIRRMADIRRTKSATHPTNGIWHLIVFFFPVFHFIQHRVFPILFLSSFFLVGQVFTSDLFFTDRKQREEDVGKRDALEKKTNRKDVDDGTFITFLFSYLDIIVILDAGRSKGLRCKGPFTESFTSFRTVHLLYQLARCAIFLRYFSVSILTCFILASQLSGLELLEEGLELRSQIKKQYWL